MSTAIYNYTKIIPWLLLIVLGFIIPGTLTIWNLYNLFAREPKLEKLIGSLTLFVGGTLYFGLHGISHIKYDDWVGGIDPSDLFYSLASEYRAAILIPVILGSIALLVLLYSNAGKLPSAVSALCIALVVILNVTGIIYAVQFTNKISLNVLYAFLYVYHVNVLPVSILVIRKHIKNLRSPGVVISTALVSVVVVLDVLFVLMGLGFTAPVKAFTETDGWVLSTT